MMLFDTDAFTPDQTFMEQAYGVPMTDLALKEAGNKNLNVVALASIEPRSPKESSAVLRNSSTNPKKWWKVI